MKKWIYIILFTCVGLTSCEKENTEELVDPEDLLASQEYFRAEIDGKGFEVIDSETVGGTIYPSLETQVITLEIYGILEKEKPEDYEGLFFMICFFDGPGMYYTGNDYNNSYADYINGDLNLWSNSYPQLDPGKVAILEHTEDFVEGTFEFKAYNEYDDSYVDIIGEFKILLEENPYDQ